MSDGLLFPDVEPFWVFDRDCLAFPAVLDGKTIRCLVTLETLIQNYGAKSPSELEMKRAFGENRAKIHDIARAMINTKQFDEHGEILIRSTSPQLLGSELSVKYSDAILKTERLRDIVQAASYRLGYGLGHLPGPVEGSWDFGPGDDRSILELKLKHVETGVTVRDWFTPDELVSVNLLKSRFQKTWGDLLRAITRKQLENVGLSGEER